MPERKTISRARRAKRAGRAPSTQAGEFVREEIHHVRKGKHGARSTQQAIAIGLSKARRAGVRLKGPKKTNKGPKKTKKSSGSKTSKPARASTGGVKRTSHPSPKRSKSAKRAFQREGSAAASKRALSKQARGAAKRRTPAQRSAAATKAARTKGAKARSQAARKGARKRAVRARKSAS